MLRRNRPLFRCEQQTHTLRCDTIRNAFSGATLFFVVYARGLAASPGGYSLRRFPGLHLAAGSLHCLEFAQALHRSAVLLQELQDFLSHLVHLHVKLLRLLGHLPVVSAAGVRPLLWGSMLFQRENCGNPECTKPRVEGREESTYESMGKIMFPSRPGSPCIPPCAEACWAALFSLAFSARTARSCPTERKCVSGC